MTVNRLYIHGASRRNNVPPPRANVYYLMVTVHLYVDLVVEYYPLPQVYVPVIK
jgi:hypothetical protein